MPIKLKAASPRRRRRESQESPNTPISAAEGFASLEEQNYMKLYNDVTNPLEIMKCRHPLETGLKLSDIVNPNNEKYNRNILKKICINDSEFEHLCENPSTSSKYRNLQLTPIQKAMTYCMIHDGGSTTDDAIVAFIMRFWKTISAYNNSDTPGSTHQKYKAPPTKRILHINYAIIRGGWPLFVEHDKNKWGANTIDGVKVRSPNSRISSKESISKINSYNHLKKEDNSKNGENIASRSRRRTAQSNSNESKSDGHSNENKIQKSRSGNDDSKPSRNFEFSIVESGKKMRSSNAQNELNSKSPQRPSIFSSLSSGNEFDRQSYFMASKIGSGLNDGENFQKLLLNAMKNDERNNNGGMTISEITQICQGFKFAPGAYFELPLERRVKSVLFMKKQLKEVDFNDENGSWIALNNKKDRMKKDFTKKIQKVLNESNNDNDNDGSNKNESESEVDDDEEESIDEKNAYLPEKLRMLNMKEITVYDLWNIVNDIGLY